MKTTLEILSPTQDISKQIANGTLDLEIQKDIWQAYIYCSQVSEWIFAEFSIPEPYRECFPSTYDGFLKACEWVDAQRKFYANALLEG